MKAEEQNFEFMPIWNIDVWFWNLKL